MEDTRVHWISFGAIASITGQPDVRVATIYNSRLFASIHTELINTILLTDHSVTKDCQQKACIHCCTDNTCEPHRETRGTLKRKEAILNGTDEITLAAAEKRNAKVLSGAFHESNLEYFGDTITVWDVREFLDNPKWRDDALRKSRWQEEMQKFEKSLVNNDEKQSKDGKKRKRKYRREKFASICEDLYRESLKKL